MQIAAVVLLALACGRTDRADIELQLLIRDQHSLAILVVGTTDRAPLLTRRMSIAEYLILTKVKKPTLSQFQPLYRGEVFGMELDLTAADTYALRPDHRYFITARYKNDDAGRWLSTEEQLELRRIFHGAGLPAQAAEAQIGPFTLK